MPANSREKALERLTRIHREQLGNMPNCQTLIERGELFDHVLHAVREHQIDVVALSAHTHPGFHFHLISSLPEKLVRQAPCHVFVIHNAG
jgi:nucleotide-binding universal stress UspA family protein